MTKPRKPLALSIGAAVVGSAALANTATASNPFGMRDLPGGYLQLASSVDGKAASTTPAEVITPPVAVSPRITPWRVP